MAEYVNPPTGVSYSAPLVDFSTIGNLANSYHEGTQQGRTRNLQNAFKEGLPKLPDGSLDIKSMTETLAKLGGADSAMPLLQMQIQQQSDKNAAEIARGGGDGSAPTNQPAAMPMRPQPVAVPPTGIPREPPPEQAPQPQSGGPNINLTGPGKAVTGVDVQNAPLPAPQVSAQQQQPPQQQQPALTPSAMDPAVAATLERSSMNKRAAAASIASTNPKAADVLLKQADAEEARAKGIREGLIKSQEPTPPMKEAAVARQPNESLPQYTARAKSLEKIGEKVGESIGTSIGEVIEAGRSSHKRIQQLAIIGDALKQGGGNITTGPFAEVVLKGKQALDSAFNLGLAGVPEAEVAQKAGFGLATQAVKEISGRPSQMEFLRGLQNNPGLLLSPRGSSAMVDILTQTARHDVELAKMAQRRENWDNWQDVQDAFFKKNPIMSPFDKKRPLGLEDAKILERESKTATADGQKPTAAKAAPQVGAVEQGYRFKGGDPADQKNWVKVVSPQ